MLNFFWDLWNDRKKNLLEDIFNENFKKMQNTRQFMHKMYIHYQDNKTLKHQQNVWDKNPIFHLPTHFH